MEMIYIHNIDDSKKASDSDMFCHAKSHILTFIGTPIVPRVFSIAMLFVLRQCEAPNLML